MTPEAETIARWRRNPKLFMTECLRLGPDEWQAEVLDAFADPANKRMSIQSCKGPGKTFIEAVMMWNFLTTRDHPNIFAISYSGDQLRDNLWKELSNLRDRSAFLRSMFEFTAERVFERKNPMNWFISARKYAKDADKNSQAAALAGIHAPYTLIVMDEAGDIPESVMVTAEASLSTGIENRLLMAGNPTRLDGSLYSAAKDTSGRWWKYEITGDPEDPKRAPRVSKEWAQNLIDTYGKDHPWVLVNVYGKFPPSSFDSLIGEAEVRKAMERAPREHEFGFMQKRIGVDVSRFGDDRTVLFPRQGLMAWAPVVMRPSSSEDKWSFMVAERVYRGKVAFGSELELIDGTGGWGAGVVDALRVMGLSPIEVNFAARANDPAKFANKRAEMWWNMADWIRSGGCLPKVPELVRELSTVKFSITKAGQILLEPKELVKARETSSPDMADALALTFALPEAEAARNPWGPGMREIRENNETPKEWDPWS